MQTRRCKATDYLFRYTYLFRPLQFFLTGAADVHFTRLQSVQNAATRLVSGARRHDHITPVLTKLHWLPVRKRVTFKTVVLVWKCLNGTAAGYLSDLCVPVASASGRQHLRSALTGHTTSSQGPNHDRPAELRCRGTISVEQSSCCSKRPEMTLHTFKRQLKSYLFHI